jgi:hypothetical protein
VESSSFLFSMPSNELLLKENEILNKKLYDAEAMMSIKKTVAHGYIALLGGLDKKSDLALSFMAITQGNVLDACFGVAENASVRRKEETPATRSAKAAKELLDECAATTNSDEFEQLAVTAYCTAFKEVVAYNDKMGKLNCITRCFRSKKIRKKAENQLRVAFTELAKAVSESS